MMPFFQKIIPQIFIAIALEDKKNVLKICTYRNKTLISSQEKTFDKSEQLMNYVKNYDKKFYPYRIALFLNSEEQGIIPSLSQDYDAFGIGKISIKTLTLNNAQLYTATEHVEYFDSEWEEFGGLDFLFSPFALLYHLIQKEQKTKTTLFAYKYSQSLCLMVCKAKEILIGDFKIFEKSSNLEFSGFEYDLNQPKNESEEGEDLKDDEEISLDNLSQTLNDKIDSLDSEEEKNPIVNDDISYNGKMELEELGQFGSDMELCRYIIASMERFYKDKHYKGDFIDEIVLFTHEDMMISTIDFLESETFIKPQVKKIDNFDLMMDLMKKELNFDL